MKPLRPALLVLIAVGCFDPLYELNPQSSWAVCCRVGLIDTCECVSEAQCSFQLTACAADTCVEAGKCPGGTGGGSGTGGGTGGSGGHSGGSGGGSGTGGGSAGGAAGGTGGGSSGDAGMPEDAGTIMDGGMMMDAGNPEDAGTMDAGIPDAGRPDAGPGVDHYEPCCQQGHVASCFCPAGVCTAAPFTACSMGRCVPVGTSCGP